MMTASREHRSRARFRAARWMMGVAWAFPFALWLGGSALADDVIKIELTIRDHRFSPSEIHVPVGKPTMLVIKNEDPTPEEFDSMALKVEKVVVGGGTVSVRLRPLGPGRYPFQGEFHPESAQGVVISE